jgi:hypothetical protein
MVTEDGGSMTEAEWFRCTDPDRMMREIGLAGTSYRKSRLFCCAYCRSFFWKYLPPGIRDAIEVAEAYADQTVSKYKLRKARDAFRHASVTTNAEWRANMVAQFAISASDPFGSARYLLENRNTLPWRGGKKAIARLIREIFGFPLGPDRTIAASVLSWNDGTIPKLAQAIYDERAFGHLPILADALEEAGCTNEGILRHCRGDDEHVRGCWVVDLMLGKG